MGQSKRAAVAAIACVALNAFASACSNKFTTTDPPDDAGIPDTAALRDSSASDDASTEGGNGDVSTSDVTPPPAGNLMPNGDMESLGCASWSGVYGGVITSTTIADAHTGVKACRFCVATLAPQGQDTSMYLRSGGFSVAKISTAGPYVIGAYLRQIGSPRLGSFIIAAVLIQFDDKATYLGGPQQTLDGAYRPISFAVSAAIDPGPFAKFAINGTWLAPGVGECLDVDDVSVQAAP
jgi:hypothetical protein